MKITHTLQFQLGWGLCLAVMSCHRAPGTALKEETASLPDSARVAMAAARSTALARVPGGQVVHEELERENGRLIYSFDIKKGPESGVEEVQVDARDGSVVSAEHEDAAKEAAESKKEGKAQH